MGSEMMVAMVLGLLGLLMSTARVASAGLPPLAGARLRLAKIVGDAKGFAQQQAAFGASKQGPATTPEPPFASTPAPAAAHLAADANLKQ